MTPALRWAAMRAILLWWTKSQNSLHKPQPFWKKKKERAEAELSWAPSAYQPNALPGQTPLPPLPHPPPTPTALTLMNLFIVGHPPPTPRLLPSVLSPLLQWRRDLQPSPCLFAADCSLWDCCGLVMLLPLGLPVKLLWFVRSSTSLFSLKANVGATHEWLRDKQQTNTMHVCTCIKDSQFMSAQ